jgi:hypothetical protein
MSTATVVRPDAGKLPGGAANLATVVVWVVVLGLFWAVALTGSKELILKGHNDFVAYYTGGRLAFSPGLYDPAAGAQEQLKAVGFECRRLPYTRPPWEAALLWPLAQVPYLQAWVLWAVALTVSILAAVALWPGLPRWLAYFLLAAYAPAVFAVINGQDVPFLLLLLAGVAALANGGLLFGAGLLLAAGQIKFHFLLPVVVMLVAGRQWRALAGGAAGTAILTVASSLVAGPDWPWRYLKAILSGAINENVACMPTFYYALRTFPGGGILWAALLAVPAWAMWRVGRRGSVADMLVVSPALVIPLVNHVFTADAVLLFPLILLTFVRSQRMPLRVLATALVSPIPWVLALAGWPWSLLVAAMILGLGLAYAASLPA